MYTYVFSLVFIHSALCSHRMLLASTQREASAHLIAAGWSLSRIFFVNTRTGTLVGPLSSSDAYRTARVTNEDEKVEQSDALVALKFLQEPMKHALLAVGASGSVAIWNLRALVAASLEHACSSILSSGYQETTSFYPCATHCLLPPLPITPNSGHIPTSISTSPRILTATIRENTLAVLDTQGHIFIYDLFHLECGPFMSRAVCDSLHSIGMSCQPIYMSLGPEGRLLAIGGLGGAAASAASIRVYNVSERREEKRVRTGDEKEEDVGLCPSEETSPATDAAVHTLASSSTLASYLSPMFAHQGHTFLNAKITALLFHPFSHCLLSADSRGELHAWQWSEKT